MNSVAKLATALAAVVVAAFVGLILLPGGAGPGDGPTPSPSPSPSASSSPAPSSTPAPSPATSIAFPPAGALTPGRHTLTEGDIVFSLQVPDGWSSSGLSCPMCANDAGWLQKGPIAGTDPGNAWLPFWSVEGVASDPCGQTPAAGATSAAELAAAVAGLPGVDVVTAPEDVTVGGRPGKHLVIKVREDIGCPAASFYMWYDANGDFRWATALGQRNEVWIVDIDGASLWIEAETYKGASPELDQEIQAIIDSIQFE